MTAELKRLREQSEDLCRQMLQAETEPLWREIADQMINVLIRITQLEAHERE